MSTSANVSKSALEGLSSGIIRFRSNLNTIHLNIKSVIDRYFIHFEAQQKRLQKLFDDRVNRLISAENELREASHKRTLRKNDDGEWKLVSIDLTPYHNKVSACRRTKDDYERKLITCKNIIEHCKYQKNIHNGTYNVIMLGIDKSVSKLDEYINDINHYNGYSINYTTEMPKTSTLDEGEAVNVIATKEETRLVLYDKEGNPIVNGNVTIVDNNIFGFGRIELQTNEKGEVSTDYISSNDCSIYLNRDEIYNGNLFQEMEYNKYGDNRFVSSLKENNTSESERVTFQELGYKQIEVTHKIKLETSGNEIRREETFKMDDNHNLQEIEITVKSDDLKAKSKDGWIKIVKQDEDD